MCDCQAVCFKHAIQVQQRPSHVHCNDNFSFANKLHYFHGRLLQILTTTTNTPPNAEAMGSLLREGYPHQAGSAPSIAVEVSIRDVNGNICVAMTKAKY